MGVRSGCDRRPVRGSSHRGRRPCRGLRNHRGLRGVLHAAGTDRPASIGDSAGRCGARNTSLGRIDGPVGVSCARTLSSCRLHRAAAFPGAAPSRRCARAGALALDGRTGKSGRDRRGRLCPGTARPAGASEVLRAGVARTVRVFALAILETVVVEQCHLVGCHVHVGILHRVEPAFGLTLDTRFLTVVACKELDR